MPFELNALSGDDSEPSPRGVDADELAQIAEDRRLVAEIGAGNDLALRRLSERLRCVPRMLAAINARKGHPLDAHDLDDVAQQAILVVLRKLHDFHGRSSIDGWAYVICSFEFANRARLKRRDSARRARDVRADTEVAPACEDSWEHEDLHLALARLPVEEQQVVFLKHFSELTFRAISKKVGASIGTVKARYYRAIDSLREGRGLDRK